MDYTPSPDLTVPSEYWRDDLDDREVMVSIRCITYNQEKYIRDALESFVNQKTNFRFEAIVHDDCSTDGTATIIREYAEKYPSIIKPIFEKENQYSKRNGSLSRVMNAHMRGKYVAMCEGDDYWTDPLKLQKQVDFMEANPEHILCWTNANRMRGNEIIGPFKRYTSNCDTSIEDTIMKGGGWIPTPSILLRKDVMFEWNSKHVNLFVGDYPLQIYCAFCGKIHYLNETTCVYRISSEGSWTSSFQKNPSLSLRKDSIKREILLLEKMNEITSNHYEDIFRQRMLLKKVTLCILENNFKEARKFHRLLDNKYKPKNIKFLLSLYGITYFVKKVFKYN